MQLSKRQSLTAGNAPSRRPPGDFLPVYLETLRLDTVLDFDLYIQVNGRKILYRNSNLPFGERNRNHLIEHQVDRLYVPAEARERYQNYIEEHLGEIVNDTAVPEPRKASIVYDTSAQIVKGVLENPQLGENINRSKRAVEAQVEFVLRGREAFVHMLSIMSFDYYTWTHSINVCTFVIALAQRLGLTDPVTLRELGTGALLHDVGKSRIPQYILNKRGKLSGDEYELMKMHPIWGAEILRETNLIPENSYYPVLQHQERYDGTGYPYGLAGDAIHLYGRITGLCDTFDAITTRRSYKAAIDSFPALQQMKQLGGHFDQRLLDELIRLLGPDEIALQPATTAAQSAVATVRVKDRME